MSERLGVLYGVRNVLDVELEGRRRSYGLELLRVGRLVFIMVVFVVLFLL
jgi:hypothetical protein